MTGEADVLRELANELRKGSGACSSSKDWNNGYLAGMEEAAKQAEKAAEALGELLTFRGIPIVFDQMLGPDDARLYVVQRSRFPFEDEADRLLPFAEAGFNVSGPQSWRIREAVRQVLIQMDKEKNGAS